MTRRSSRDVKSRPKPDGDILPDLLRRIRRRKVVFFLGAGASCDPPSNLPSSAALLQELANRIALPSPPDSTSKVRRRFARGVRFEIFFQAMVTALGEKALGALDVFDRGVPNQHHTLVARLAETQLSPLVLTTNFDSLLEEAIRSRFKSRPQTYFQRAHFRGFPSPLRRFKIVKLHGSLRDGESRDARSSILLSVLDVGKPMPKEKRRVLVTI